VLVVVKLLFLACYAIYTAGSLLESLIVMSGLAC